MYEVTVKLQWSELNLLEDALLGRLEELELAAAREERLADERKARGLCDAYHREEMAGYEARAAIVRTAIADLKK